MKCEVCGKDSLRSCKAVNSPWCCPECFEGYTSPHEEDILHVRIPNRYSKTLTEAYRKDVRMRRVAEDGCSVVRDRKGNMPSMIARLNPQKAFELGLRGLPPR